jgi:hypothetical protein
LCGAPTKSDDTMCRRCKRENPVIWRHETSLVAEIEKLDKEGGRERFRLGALFLERVRKCVPDAEREGLGRIVEALYAHAAGEDTSKLWSAEILDLWEEEFGGNDDWTLDDIARVARETAAYAYGCWVATDVTSKKFREARHAAYRREDEIQAEMALVWQAARKTTTEGSMK